MRRWQLQHRISHLAISASSRDWGAPHAMSALTICHLSLMWSKSRTRGSRSPRSHAWMLGQEAGHVAARGGDAPSPGLAALQPMMVAPQAEVRPKALATPLLEPFTHPVEGPERKLAPTSATPFAVIRLHERMFAASADGTAGLS